MKKKELPFYVSDIKGIDGIAQAIASIETLMKDHSIDFDTAWRTLVENYIFDNTAKEILVNLDKEQIRKAIYARQAKQSNKS